MSASIRWAWTALVLCATPVDAQVGAHHRFTFRGDALLDGLGAAVAVIPDLNGDGIDDLLAGAPQPFQFAPGYVSVFSGADGLELYRIEGPPPTGAVGDRFGSAIVVLGDLDGDGFADFAVGTPEDDDAGFEAGSVSIHSGADGALLRRYLGLSAGERFGATLAVPGDVDGDGFKDLLVGAPGSLVHAPNLAGRVELLSGGWLVATLAGQGPSGPESFWSVAGVRGFGRALAGVGDLVGDASIDVAVGSPAAGLGGEVVLLDGATGAEFARLVSPTAKGVLGRALASQGDLNGDGHSELGVGAPGFGAAGRVWVLDGAALAGLTGAVDITSLASPYVFDGASSGEGFGSALASGGDFDGDGLADLAVGATDGTTTLSGGRATVYSGANGAPLLTVTGAQSGGLAGSSMVLGGDLDGDGGDDLVIGVPRDDDGRGAAVAYSNSAATLVTDRHLLALDSGGTVVFELWAGAPQAADIYVLVGTASGTQPGTPVAGLLLPIALDGYTLYTLAAPPEQVGFFGVLDAAGFASASIVLPPNTPPALAGSTLHFAYLALDPGPGLPGTLVSNAVPVSLSINACLALDPGQDCNDNGQLDTCDVLDGLETDCNSNGVLDSCELAAGTAVDADMDGFIDTCQSVVFVDANATGLADGSSWLHAFTELRDGLAAVQEFGQVWVADGVYRPGVFPSPPETSFFLPDRGGLYGGFAGGESSLAERDPAANSCILDGDLAGDDGLPGGSLADNVWSVVTSPASNGGDTVMDGFVVRRGAADEADECDGLVAMFDKCRGAGLYCLGAPLIRDCVFEDHFAAYNGGAIYVAADATFVRCVVRRSSAYRGGGAYVDLGAQPQFLNSHFSNNQAFDGGALFVNGNPGEGALLVGCLLHANSAAERGGAIFATGASVELSGCTLSYNSCLGPLGGLGGEFGATWQIDGSLLWGNLGDLSSGGVGGQLAQLDGLGATVGHSCIEGWSGALGGIGNFGLDPLLTDFDGPDGQLGSLDDDLSLAAGSPCRDAGDGPALGLDPVDLDADGLLGEPFPLDVLGNPRFADDPAAADVGLPVQGLVPDIGAIEG